MVAAFESHRSPATIRTSFTYWSGKRALIFHEKRTESECHVSSFKRCVCEHSGKHSQSIGVLKVFAKRLTTTNCSMEVMPQPLDFLWISDCWEKTTEQSRFVGRFYSADLRPFAKIRDLRILPRCSKFKSHVPTSDQETHNIRSDPVKLA
jgi:hypothetical protein